MDAQKYHSDYNLIEIRMIYYLLQTILMSPLSVVIDDPP